MGNLLAPILILLVVFVRAESSPPFTPDLLPVTGLALLLHLGGVFLLGRFLVRALARHPDGPALVTRILGLANVALYLGLVIRSPWIPLCLEVTLRCPLLDMVASLAPMVVGIVLVSQAAHSLEQRGSWVPAATLRVRMLATTVAPLLVLKALRDLAALPPGWKEAQEAYLPLTVLELMGSLAVVYALSPLLLRYVVGARPLPAGSLRDRLLAYNERIRFRPNDILVWNTGGRLPNALFIGILPRLRYVILTDALIDQLDIDQVEGVYAHEAGHGVKRHMPLFVLLFAGFYLFMLLVADPFTDFVTGLFPDSTLGDSVAQLASSVVLAVAPLLGFFMGFGWLSRRFETEADVFAVDTLRDPAHFARALERVGLHAGVLGRRGGLRHFGIGRRIGLLNRYLCEPGFRRELLGTLRRCRIGIVAFFALGLALLAWRTPALLRLGDYRLGVQQALAKAEDSRRRADFEYALAEIDRLGASPELAERAEDDRQRAKLYLADALLAEGDYPSVRRSLTEIEAWPRATAVDRWNLRNLRAQIGALDGTVDRAFVRQVLREFSDLGGADDPRNGDCLADLYLAARALGDRDPAPAPTKNYRRAAARLLLALESTQPLPADASALAETAMTESAWARDAFIKAKGADPVKALDQRGR